MRKNKSQRRLVGKSELLLILCISTLLFIIVFLFVTALLAEAEEINTIHPNRVELKDVLEKEVREINSSWVCRHYAEYYYNLFTEKYPELDVRWIRNADPCNNGEICNVLHTFVVVIGYNGECIVDQTELVCIGLEGG